MPFFHVKKPPGFVWPPIADAQSSQVWAAYLTLERTQWLSPAELLERQLEQVRHLLAHCIIQVPYYHRLLTEANVVPARIQTMEDFRRIPLLERRTFQEKPQEFLAQRLPPGTKETGMVQTSGSTGSPMIVLQTNVVNLWWTALFLRDLQWCDFEPTGALAVIRNTKATGTNLERMLAGTRLSCWQGKVKDLIETGPLFSMDIQQDPRLQWQWLREVSPDYLLTYPATLEVLAELARAAGERLPRLRAIQSISDTLTDHARARIESAFGVPVKNSYSCNEVGYLASPCPQGPGLHVHSENVLFEVLADDGSACRPGQTGRISITHLHNYRNPLVRYFLGDHVTLAGEPCPCGRGLPLLTSVQGKYWPLFHLPEGRRKSSAGAMLMVRKVGDHLQHQIVQKTLDHVVVRVVPTVGWTDEHSGKVRRGLQDFFEGPIHVDVELLERLEVPRGGKFQCLVCEIDNSATVS